jgi:hypothetical protein
MRTNSALPVEIQRSQLKRFLIVGVFAFEGFDLRLKVVILLSRA